MSHPLVSEWLKCIFKKVERCSHGESEAMFHVQVGPYVRNTSSSSPIISYGFHDLAVASTKVYLTAETDVWLLDECESSNDS